MARTAAALALLLAASSAGPAMTADRDRGGRVAPGPELAVSAQGRRAEVIHAGDTCMIAVDGRVVVGGPGMPNRPIWSPDGRTLAYVSGESGVASLWTVDLESGERLQLTNVGLAAGAPLPATFVPPPVRGEDAVWTPDGRLVWNAGDSVWSCLEDGDGCLLALDGAARPQIDGRTGDLSLVRPDGHRTRLFLDPRPAGVAP